MRKTLLSLAIAAICPLAASSQYVADPNANTKVTETVNNYGNYAAVSNDGVLYSVQLIPGRDDKGNTTLAYNLQILDKDGNRLMPAGGQTVSDFRNLSYTVVNDVLYADNDGNCLVMVSDCRNAPAESNARGYTIYKFGPDGKMVWPGGVDLSDGSVFEGAALLKAVQVADGGYVFAFVAPGDAATPARIYMEKLTKDGEKAWPQPVELADSKTPYTYPYLVDAGDNQVLMVYAEGSNQYIKSQLYDFDGTPLWEKPLTVYQGGFDDTPLHTKLRVAKAPEGAFVTWSDDRNYENVYSNYISYVRRDGTLGFPGGTNALKISYANDYSRQVPMLAYNAEEQSVYAIYRQYDQAYQTLCGIFMQKIGIDGELQWGPEGKAIIDMQQDRAVGYATVQNAGDTDMAVFYQTNSHVGKDAKTYVMRIDKDGNDLWEEALEPATTVSEKSDLLSSALIDGNYWIITWEDLRGSSDYFSYALYAQRINADGTLAGTGTGIDAPEAATAATGEASAYSLSGTLVKQSVTDSGAMGLAPGIYVIKDKATGKASKVTVK